jgi:hypothetical protein
VELVIYKNEPMSPPAHLDHHVMKLEPACVIWVDGVDCCEGGGLLQRPAEALKAGICMHRK